MDGRRLSQTENTMLRYPAALLVLLLSGCTLTPDYQRPPSPVPARFAQTEAAPVEPGVSDDRLRGQTIFRDPLLRELIERALRDNRDLRVAALNVQAYRAQFRLQRAEQLPHLSADAQGQRQYLPRRMTGSDDGAISQTYSATLGLSAFELDLFGRLRSLSDKALLTYLASEQARRSVQLTLVASVASSYLTWRADLELLALSHQTLEADQQRLHLTQGQRRAGSVSALQVLQAQTRVETGRTAVARYQRQVAQDVNQLSLLVGSTLDERLPGLPLAAEQVVELPAGLPDDLLQRRPDILEAEYRLRAANADIGAARAAFFPGIRLTTSAGSASRELSGLFDGGSGTWLFQPQISLPLFTAGSLRASLDYAQLQKTLEVARYEKSIQTAFQEVSDGLAARSTYRRQLLAQRDLVDATQRYYDLASNRYRAGVDSSLTFLDAQRSLFSARQGLIDDRLAQLLAEVNLYVALGGGWAVDEQHRRSAP